MNVEHIPEDGFQDLPKTTQTVLLGGVLVVLGLTLWGMKKISDGCNQNKKKETWAEWLTR